MTSNTNAKAAPAKGCGKQIHIAGTNGGTMACGSLLRRLNGELTPQYCPACKSATGAPGKGQHTLALEYHIAALGGKPALYNTRRGLVAVFEAGYGQTREQDARKIVAILNSHAALIEALEQIVRDSKPCLDSPPVGWVDVPAEDLHQARAALALAEGGDK